MVRSKEPILLSGVPRSGTTLCCHLLNRFENTVALHEPIEPGLFSENKPNALQTIREFSRQCRRQALEIGSVPTKQRDGKIPDNPVSNSDGKRLESVFVDDVSLDKPLEDDFLLVIKHNALFTALLAELRQEFQVFALVRNPLPVLASWRSVELPVGDGRLPMGELLCPELSRTLAEEADLLTRQLLILEWFFDAYRELDSSELLTYEELVETNAGNLRRITPYPPSEELTVDAQYKNSQLSSEEVNRLASILLARPEIYEGFYSKEDIEAAKIEMIS